MGVLKWAVATVVFEAMAWALYAASRRHDDFWEDESSVFLALSAISAAKAATIPAIKDFVAMS